MNAIFKMAYIANFFNGPKDVEGFENLQKLIIDKKEYLEKVLFFFNNIDRYLRECSNRILNLNTEFIKITLSPEEKDIHGTAESIIQKICKNIEEDIILIGQLMTNLDTHISQLNKEKKFYDELKKINKDLQEEKEKLKKNKEIYHKMGKDSEYKIKQFVKNNLQCLNDVYESEILMEQLSQMTEPTQRALNNYKANVKKTNELIKKYNQKQTLLFNFLPELGGEDGVFYFRLIKLYLNHLEKESKYLISNIERIKNMKSLETNSKLKDLIDIAENNKRDEKIVNLIHYQTELDLNKCENDKDFEIFCGSVVFINTFVDDSIFPNFNSDEEIKNYKICQIIKNLFKEKGEIDSKLSEDFFKLIEDPFVHNEVFIILSNLRTNNRFLRTKYLIDLLGKAFNILLSYAEKNNLFENVKNLLILSQTYYYLNENKNKVYIFEYIKNNKWLKSSSFWRNFIDDMIKKEFIRFEKYLPDYNFSVANNININKNIKKKLNEVVFSQILTYVSNMKDFDVDRRVILKITDEFIKKYNYLSKENINSIYDIISEGNKDIEKLRKEYDPSLEKELINEQNNNIEDKEKENNEDIKDNNKINDEKKDENNINMNKDNNEEKKEDN